MYANKKMNRIISSVAIVLFAIIITTIAAVSIVLESGIINVSHGQLLQRSPPTGSKVTTPGANPMCDPTDTSINTTESHVCGLPKTTSPKAAEPLSSTTPGANPMCDPTDTSINTTESHVCGLPKTPSATGATSESTTTTEPPGSVSPSSPGSTSSPPPPPSGQQESPIPGLPGLQ
jgi:hypothetical protein